MTSMVALVRPNPCDQFLVLMAVDVPVAGGGWIRRCGCTQVPSSVAIGEVHSTFAVAQG